MPDARDSGTTREDDPERTKRDQARREFNEGWDETIAKINRDRQRGIEDGSGVDRLGRTPDRVIVVIDSYATPIWVRRPDTPGQPKNAQREREYVRADLHAGAVEENERLRKWIADSTVAMQARHAGIITLAEYGDAQRRRFGGQ